MQDVFLSTKQIISLSAFLLYTSRKDTAKADISQTHVPVNTGFFATRTYIVVSHDVIQVFSKSLVETVLHSTRLVHSVLKPSCKSMMQSFTAEQIQMEIRTSWKLDLS